MNVKKNIKKGKNKMPEYGTPQDIHIINIPEGWEEFDPNSFDYKEDIFDKIFPKGIGRYGAKYAIFHPWVVLEDWCYEIKYAWQRVFRKWDDTVPWSVDYYLAEMIPQWLKRIKDNKQGIPAVMFHEEDCLDENYNVSESTMELRRKEYDEILDAIILGFESYIEMQDLYDKEKIKPLEENFDNGMELFVKYYRTLWD
jgi:hypothetical protein